MQKIDQATNVAPPQLNNKEKIKVVASKEKRSGKNSIAQGQILPQQQVLIIFQQQS